MSTLILWARRGQRRRRLLARLAPSMADPLWPFNDGVSIALALQLVFWLGVVVTMLGYQVGFLEPSR